MLMEIEDRNKIIDFLKGQTEDRFIVAIINEIRDVCNGFGIDEERLIDLLKYHNIKSDKEIIRILKVMNDG